MMDAEELYADPSQRASGKPRWAATMHLVEPGDAEVTPEVARIRRGGVPGLLLGRATVQQHDVATRLLQRVLLAERGVPLETRLHASGVWFLEHDGPGGRRIRGFVVASVSSMEPNPVWPMRLPAAVLQVARIDWVGACSVPKTPALECIEESPPEAFVLGWLPMSTVVDLPVDVLEPHPDHEFTAEYRLARNFELRSIASFPSPGRGEGEGGGPTD